MNLRHFIRINDKFIRFDRIKSITVDEYFTTDSMAIIKIFFFNGSEEQIVLLSDNWISGEDAEKYFRPKIKQIIELIEGAISGNITDYFIEV